MPRLLILLCIAFLAGCGAAPAAPTPDAKATIEAAVKATVQVTNKVQPTATPIRGPIAPAAAATMAPAAGATSPPTTAPVKELPVPAGPTPAGDTGQGAPPTVIVPSVVDAPAVITLVADLRRRGIEPAPTSASGAEFLADAPGQAYRVGSGWLYLHLYPSAEAAGTKHGRVRQGLANPKADYPPSPHAFQCGAVIALYVGRDEPVTRALTELCGPQFAGRE